MRFRMIGKSAVLLGLFSALAFAPAMAQETGSIAGSLKSFVDDQTLAGAVTLVASKDKILALEAIGFADRESQKMMKSDAVFWIASMSKPITGIAIMMLIDEGKLKIDDPVEKFLPEFKGQMLVEERGKDRLVLKKPARPITVKDLLSHTSGLVLKTPLESKTLDALTLREAVQSYALSPLQFEPGSQYQYCNPGINTAGRIVEVLSGMSFEDFLQKRLFTPLEMKDTTFWPQGDQLKRLAKSYKAGPDKKGLEATTVTALSYPFDNRQRQAFPGGGLFSTAADLAAVCQMVLGNGVYKGKRYLSEDSVQQMSMAQTGKLKVGGAGSGYGLGWATLDGSGFGHGGAYATWMWIEPRQERVLIFLVQHNGFPGDGAKSRAVFQKTALEKFGK